MTKAKMGFDQHVVMGRKIKTMDMDITQMLIELQDYYPKKSPVIRHVVMLKSAIGEVKNALDNAVCREFPKEPLATKCYYGADYAEYHLTSSSK